MMQYIAAIIALIVMGSLVSGCRSLIHSPQCDVIFDIIRNEIASNNGCYNDADCMLVEDSGTCDIVANQATAVRIHHLLIEDGKYRKCFFECDQKSIPKCYQGQCIRIDPYAP